MSIADLQWPLSPYRDADGRDRCGRNGGCPGYIEESAFNGHRRCTECSFVWSAEFVARELGLPGKPTPTPTGVSATFTSQQAAAVPMAPEARRKYAPFAIDSDLARDLMSKSNGFVDALTKETDRAISELQERLMKSPPPGSGWEREIDGVWTPCDERGNPPRGASGLGRWAAGVKVGGIRFKVVTGVGDITVKGDASMPLGTMRVEGSSDGKTWAPFAYDVPNYGSIMKYPYERPFEVGDYVRWYPYKHAPSRCSVDGTVTACHGGRVLGIAVHETRGSWCFNKPVIGGVVDPSISPPGTIVRAAQPVTAAGRAQAVMDLAQRGAITADEARKLLEMPELPPDSPRPTGMSCTYGLLGEPECFAAGKYTAKPITVTRAELVSETKYDGLTGAQCLERLERQQRDEPIGWRIRWRTPVQTGIGMSFPTFEACDHACLAYNERADEHPGITHSAERDTLTSAQLAAARELWSLALKAKVAESKDRERRRVVIDMEID